VNRPVARDDDDNIIIVVAVLVLVLVVVVVVTPRLYLSDRPGKHKIKELQKTAVWTTPHKLRKMLMYKSKTYFTCEITLHVAHCKHRTAATGYTLET